MWKGRVWRRLRLVRSIGDVNSGMVMMENEQMDVVAYILSLFYILSRNLGASDRNISFDPCFPFGSYFISCDSRVRNGHDYDSSTNGCRRSISSSSLISSPIHCCSTPSGRCLGGINTSLTTWITPSLAMPSSIVTLEKPLILILMKRP